LEFSQHPASFRDPSGFVFSYDGIIYRQVNNYFKNNFGLLMNSGLYHSAIEKRLMISHQQINKNFSGENNWYTTLLPEQLNYLSYPFEWSFDMLKDAALTTLEAAGEAIKFGMVLKDASAFNIQFHKGKMQLIDSLSFEKYDGSSPWVAYRQFCEQFAAPLICMHYLKYPLQELLFAHVDGIPLPLAKKIVPWRSKLNLNILLHLHLHVGFTSKKKNNNSYQAGFSILKLQQLYKSLEETIRFCKPTFFSTAWSDYYEEASLREDYLKNKKEIVKEWINTIPAEKAVDLGANDGTFSEILAARNIYTISADYDSIAVNKLYKRIRETNNEKIHPLILNLSNPTPAFGFNNEERMSFVQRTKVDIVLALAVVHHLTIAKNIPFELIASFFSRLGKILIIEFVPKDDPKIKIMLEGRKDIFEAYTEENFLNAFCAHYKILGSREIGKSKRKLFFMEVYKL
jgi:hypothetical protein